jgi:hypothetical protein
MNKIAHLETQRDKILKEIREIRAMRKGSVTEQYLKVKQQDQEEPALRGPYYLYSRKEKGKTVGRRLKKDEVPRYQEEVDNFHYFQSLCDEYAQTTEKLGDIEQEISEEVEKKQRKSRLKKKRK